MTKLEKQKQFVCDEFSKTFEADRFGNFKHGEYRIKINKTSFRFERKVAGKWLRVGSSFYKDATQNLIKSVTDRMLIGCSL